MSQKAMGGNLSNVNLKIVQKYFWTKIDNLYLF